MSKFRYASIPACITFGPLFMVMGTTPKTLTEYVTRLGGALMLAVGLGLTLTLIAAPQKAIDELRRERRNGVTA